MDFSEVEACVDEVIARVGRQIVLGIPLGIGKPNRFVNALYRRAINDASLQLKIFTALTPAVPVGKSLLEKLRLRHIRPLCLGRSGRDRTRTGRPRFCRRR